MGAMKIGELAKVMRVKVDTIRFYEKNGLLPKPKRLYSGYRIYNDDSLRQIKFIIKCKEVGFSLKEIKELQEIQQSCTKSACEVYELAQQKLEDIEDKLSELAKIKSLLKALSDVCPREGSVNSCPIIAGLSQ